MHINKHECLYTQVSQSEHKEPSIFGWFKITARRFRDCLWETKLKEKEIKDLQTGLSSFSFKYKSKQ